MNMVCTTDFVLCRASQIRDRKLLKLLTAGVAKLVDARDLKFLRSIVFIEHFCTTSSKNEIEYHANPCGLHNGFRPTLW
jgi:hypothetical protein